MGDAAIYINNLKVTKKRQAEEKRRLSLISSESSPFDMSAVPPSSTSPDKCSPESLITDSASSSSRTWIQEIEGDPKLPLVDSNDLDFIMQEVYSDGPKKDHYFGAFTTLDESEQPRGEHLNLRQRIKMMEDGQIPEEKLSSSNIIW